MSDRHADPVSESVIVADILVAVSALDGAMFYRNNTGALPNRQGRMVTFGLKGSADILGVHRGRAVAIEAKTPTGRQRTSQVRFQEAWERAGGIYILARSASDALRGLGVAA